MTLSSSGHRWPTVHSLLNRLRSGSSRRGTRVRIGWSPCLPLAPRSKVPLISAANGGHGLHDATTDLDVIRAWWRVNPRANIGLRTGLSFDVIDLDNEAPVDALEQARGGREPLRGPVVQTCHGFHWYVKPTGVGNRAGVLQGVDFRCRGGYVLSTALCSSRGLPIPLDQPLARRACACAGSAHSAPRSRTWSSTTPNGATRGPEPMDLERYAESFSGSRRQGKALATTNSTPLRSRWAG